ncbi:MAG: hypothetical protein A2V70_19485 [Planctomycetes bacterium RBG_13_63_9]|nr:MAG: hypothetical protein A2V70_19485 [Planctomycetes bacterium RBG_13_63_9]
MFHLAAFEQSIDPAAALVAINGIREEQFQVNTVDFRVKAGLDSVLGAAATINDASATRAQLQSPSLRMLANLDVEPIIAALLFGSLPVSGFRPGKPVPLVADENVNFAVQSDPAAAAIHRGFVWFGDGPQTPVDGSFFTIRATSAVTLVTGTWVNGNVVFGQVLPTGRYQVIGMRARGANLVAARLVFPEQVARPGCLAVNAIGNLSDEAFRAGYAGVWGEFDNTVPPTVDCLGTVDAAQTYLLDLVKIG